MIKKPQEGLKGIIENWQSDLLAAISVSLVALPLGLGIALACGISPIAGVYTAIIGGIVTTIFRNSHVSINGPSAGIIAVVLAGVAIMEDGSGNAINYVFAAIVVSGAIQIILGLLKLGILADIFHTSVVNGLLAAIGVIIFAKQIHYVLGTTTETTTIIGNILDAIKQIPNLNPFVFIIALVGFVLLIFHSKISYKFFHFLPAPLWVLILSIPFVYLFNYFEAHNYQLFGKTFSVGPELLINIPNNVLDAIIFPKFDAIKTSGFWTTVFSITLISSIESLASAKAVDNLDPYKRKTNLNKELSAIGIATMVSGAIGGLPVISVIVRSTVNVHNHAKTKWSNFYHGVLLLVFIFLLAPVIQKIPLVALATLLVFTGYKLASPKVFQHVREQGIEQFIIFTATLLITLFTDLLIGIFGGLLVALFIHYFMLNISIGEFFGLIFKSGTSLEQKNENDYELKVKGIANFLATLKIMKLLGSVPDEKNIVIDFRECRLLDFSLQEDIQIFKDSYKRRGGTVKYKGLETHFSSNEHRFGLKYLNNVKVTRTSRAKTILKLAEEKAWGFKNLCYEKLDFLETFYFFQTKHISNRRNVVSCHNNAWEIFDVKFEEGAYLAMEEYRTTLGLINCNHKIPKFTFELKTFTDKYLNWSSHKDIDYVLYENFSNDYLVKVEEKEEMDKFLNEDLRNLISNSDFIHHLESNGEAVLVFMDKIKLADKEDYKKIIAFEEALKDLIK
ncbi:MAG: SulP family inorganic anion transporter [Chitinophagales bacterium]